MPRVRTILALALLALLLAGCSNLKAEYAILKTDLAPAEMKAGETTRLRVEVGKTEGRQQVHGTDNLTVSVAAPGGITAKPVVTAYETAQPDGSLKITMRPGGQLPRTFQFDLAVAANTPPGEHKITVNLGANSKSSSVQVTVKVK